MYPPPKYFPSNYTYHLSLHLALTLGCFFGVSLLSISNANSHPRISISLTNALLSENIAGSEVKRERLTLSSGDEGTDLSSIIIASLQLTEPIENVVVIVCLPWRTSPGNFYAHNNTQLCFFKTDEKEWKTRPHCRDRGDQRH